MRLFPKSQTALKTMRLGDSSRTAANKQDVSSMQHHLPQQHPTEPYTRDGCRNRIAGGTDKAKSGLHLISKRKLAPGACSKKQHAPPEDSRHECSSSVVLQENQLPSALLLTSSSHRWDKASAEAEDRPAMAAVSAANSSSVFVRCALRVILARSDTVPSDPSSERYSPPCFLPPKHSGSRSRPPRCPRAAATIDR